MNIEDIEIGMQFFENDNQKRIVTVIDKTTNSIQYKDSRYYSWISIVDLKKKFTKKEIN